AATVKLNGCKYTLTGQAELTAEVDLTGCTTGKRVEISVTGCTATIPEQTGLSHIVFTNLATTPKTVEGNITVQGIAYEFDGTLCPEAQGVLHHDGDYTGKAVVKAYEDQGATEQVTTNGHQYSKLLPGSQVGMFAT